MGDVKARPVADRATLRAQASSGTDVPASAGGVRAVAHRQPVRKPIDADWVLPLETPTVLTESPEYVQRSLEGPPPGLSDELLTEFSQLPLRNSLPPGGNRTADITLTWLLPAAVFEATLYPKHHERDASIHVTWGM